MEEAPEQEEDAGGGWIMTFADLMSLLMCFFVLLLSFAELDVLKFKAIAGSMKLAFGVQREVKAPDVPMGTSLIKTEFSPGKPDPTIISQVRQTTTDVNKQTLELSDALSDPGDGGQVGDQTEQFEQTERDAETIVRALKDQIDEGTIHIETHGASIVIRINEKASFPSGQAEFRSGFTQVIGKLRDALSSIEGKIVVAGHTDNVPIKTSRFRSNWDLSAARAVSVLHELVKGGALEVERFIAEGHGDAHPLVPNDTMENRTINRRVELTIEQSTGAAEPVEEPLVMANPGDSKMPSPSATQAKSEATQQASE